MVINYKGKEVLIDEEDSYLLKDYNWSWINSGTVKEKWYLTRGFEGRTLYLHREIINPKVGLISDHKDGNTLNCTRDNLRAVSPYQNRINSSGWSVKKLPKGVYQKKGRDAYYAMVQRSCKKSIYLGSFVTIEEAENIYHEVNNKIISGESTYQNELDKYLAQKAITDENNYMRQRIKKMERLLRDINNRRLTVDTIIRKCDHMNKSDWHKDRLEIYWYLKTKSQSKLGDIILGFTDRCLGYAIKITKNKPLAEDLVQDATVRIITMMNEGRYRIDLERKNYSTSAYVSGIIKYEFYKQRRINKLVYVDEFYEKQLYSNLE